MVLNTYEEIVRHLHHFGKHPIYVSPVDSHRQSVINVQLNSIGLQVLTTENKWYTVKNNVYNDLTEEQFYPKIKGKKTKGKKKK